MCHTRNRECLEQSWLSIRSLRCEGGWQNSDQGVPLELMHPSLQHLQDKSRPPMGRISIEENPGMEIAIVAAISFPIRLYANWCRLMPQHLPTPSDPLPAPLQSCFHAPTVRYFHGDSSADPAAPG